jgi:hypothetical protein
MEDTIEICSGCGKLPRPIDFLNGQFLCSRCGSAKSQMVHTDHYEETATALDAKFHRGIIESRIALFKKEGIGNNGGRKSPRKASKPVRKAVRKPVKKTVRKAVKKARKPAANKPVRKAVKKTAKKPLRKAVKKTVKKAIKRKPVKKTAKKRKR